MQICTRVQICLVMFAVGLGLPAQADEKTSQADFVDDCNADGLVTVLGGQELEVVNYAGLQGVITTDCTVTLAGEDSGLTLAEGTDLLFQGAGGTYTNFTITGVGPGPKVEVQVKKNSSIQANDFTIDLDGPWEAEAQFGEDFCLRLHGDMTLSLNTGTDEGGDVQFKKFVGASCGYPNIDVDGDINITVAGPGSEIQIEEFNGLRAGRSISVTGNGLDSHIQSKKDVTFVADLDITVTAPSSGGEVQVEENIVIDAGRDILLSAGPNGKMEVKKVTVLYAGNDCTVSVGTGGGCKIEADQSTWSAGGSVTTCD